MSIWRSLKVVAQFGFIGVLVFEPLAWPSGVMAGHECSKWTQRPFDATPLEKHPAIYLGIRHRLPPPFRQIVSTGRPARYLVERLYALRDVFGPDLNGFKQKSVVDLGAGTSEIARYLAESYGARAVQMDWWYELPGYLLWRVFSEYKTESLEKFIEVNKQYLMAGTFQNTGFENASVDVVLSAHVFRHFYTFEQMESGLREVVRILSPGGVAVITPVRLAQKQLMLRLCTELGVRVELLRIQSEFPGEGVQYRLIVRK